MLLAFDREHPEWGVTEVATEFGLDKSVAQRLLAALAYRHNVGATVTAR